MAAFTPLQFDDLSASASSWTKSSISSSYQHLLLRVSHRVDTSSTATELKLVLNGDPSSAYGNYTSQGFYTNYNSNYFSAFQKSTGSGVASFGMGRSSGSTAAADCFCQMEVWILNYASTTQDKVIFLRNLQSNDQATAGSVYGHVAAHLYSDTSTAISQLTLSPTSGSFVQYSTFTLYGVTGA